MRQFIFSLHQMTTEELKKKITRANEETTKGNFDTAEQLANEVLAELDTPSTTVENIYELRANAILALSGVASLRGNFEQALSLGQTSFNIAQEHAMDAVKARACFHMGRAQYRIGANDTAMECFNTALAVYEALGDKIGIATINGNMANIYSNLGAYDKSFDYLANALTIFKELGDKSTIARITGNIGILYYNLGTFGKALEYFTEALAVQEKLGEKSMIARAIGNIANAYSGMGLHEKALEYQKKSLALQQELGDKFGTAHTIGHIGIEYLKLGSYDTAMDYFQRALAMHNELGTKPSGALMLLHIGILYAKEKFSGYDIAKAEKILLETEALDKEIKSKKELVECYHSLSELYEKQQRTEEALLYFKKYHELEKEVQSDEATKQAQQMENRRKVEEAERDRQVKLVAFKAKETILHHVLPAQIAERIAGGEQNIADYFPTVSILFADIEGFTPMTADMPAHLVVKFLNHVFTHFDHIMKKHGCEKIKTIGDGYMAVAGAPTECADHAERIANAALEMIKPIELPDEIKPFIPTGKNFSIRIGIHTGSVVAGVVGEDRFVYDIYSDAVNTAARMESHGKNGRIHVSSDFMKHLSNRFSQNKNTTHGITFESRGEMEIKGKGKMKTFFINGN
jgi:class 3 adenylate cyclase/tetratricopeptide (TPR) repeat protein